MMQGQGHLSKTRFLTLAIIFLMLYTSSGHLLVGLAVSPLTVSVTGTSPAKVGVQANFTATASGGSGSYSYVWNATGAQPSFGTGPSFSTEYIVKGSYNVNVTVTDTSGATAMAFTTVTITPLPLTVSISGPMDATVGYAVTFNAQPNQGTSPYSLSWTATGGNPSSGTGSTLTTTYSSTGSFTVKVSATDANGATASSSATINVHPLGALGIDCAYGSNVEGGAFPASVTTSAPYMAPDFDGTLDTSCQATYLGDTDGAIHPLVSDNPTAIVLPGSGGGITIDIVFSTSNPTTTLNAFDLSLKYDVKELNAVAIDQSGLIWAAPPSPAFVLTLAKTIDNTAGTVRLAQALVGAFPSGTVELFRVRFDIVGSGSSGISIFKDFLGNPAAIPYTLRSLNSLDTRSIFDTLNMATLGFQDNWTFTPNPEVPGQPLTFSAANAFCPGCTGPFTYNWDFSSNDSPTYVPKTSATGQSVTAIAPPPVINRVTLNVTDAANHHMLLVRQLPLAVAVYGTTNLSVGVAGGSWTAKWLGGLVTSTAGYSGHWTFCPGSLTNKAVCSAPTTITFTQSGSSINQTVAFAGITYVFGGFYNNTFHIQDGSNTEAQLGHVLNTAIAGSANVTGTPQAFAVTLTQQASHAVVYKGVTFTATVTYDPSYPPYSNSLGFRSLDFKYSFDFGDGSSGTIVNGGLSVQVPWNYTSPGAFNVRVEAVETDQSPRVVIEGTAFLPLTIIPLICPVLGACGISFSSASVTVGQEVTFTAAVSGGLQPYTYNWKFGDGTSSTGVSVNHTYQSSGNLNVTLTITDSSGQTHTLSKILTVAPPAQSPFFTSPLGLATIAAVIALALVGTVIYTRRRRTKLSPNPSASPSQS